MKEIIYKFFTIVFVLLTFYGMLHAMRLLSAFNDYNYIKVLARKNVGLTADGPEIPAVSAKAPAEAMRTKPAPVTAEDLSYIYLDGIRFDFPITLDKLKENFDIKTGYSYYDNESSEYLGKGTILKNGIGTYRIKYIADSKYSPPEECIITSITASDYNKKYFPQLVAAGFDVFDTSEEEYLRLADLDKYEYLMTTAIAYPEGNNGYVEFDFIRSKGIYYDKNDDPILQDSLESIYPYLIKKELWLPEDYDFHIIPDSKEETREFVHECIDSDIWISTHYIDDRVIKRMVNDVYLTSYEFLALPYDDYEAEYYEIELLDDIRNNDGIYTGYLHIEARCHIKGYEKPVYTEMVLKAGEPLGNALIIRIEL